MNDEVGTTWDSGTEAGSWSIGADASLQAVLDSPDCPPLLRSSLERALVWQERNRRQVGRALVSPTIAPQWSAALLALGATVSVQTDSGPIPVPLEDLIRRRVAGRVMALHVRAGAIRWGEAHVGRTPADDPIVAAVAGLEMDGDLVGRACIALTGVWEGPVQVAGASAQLVGRRLTEPDIKKVAEAVEKEVTPRGDFRGSVEYRRAMAGVLTRRALAQCLWEVHNG